MRRLFDLPRHMTVWHIVGYFIVAAIAVFMLAATLGMLLALGGAALSDSVTAGNILEVVIQ